MFDYVVNHAGELLSIAASVVAAASLIAALTPNKTDDKVVSVFKKVVNFFALNIGHAAPPKDKS